MGIYSFKIIIEQDDFFIDNTNVNEYETRFTASFPNEHFTVKGKTFEEIQIKISEIIRTDFTRFEKRIFRLSNDNYSLDTKTKMINALDYPYNYNPPTLALVRRWEKVAAKKKHVDVFGDIILEGEDYIRKKLGDYDMEPTRLSIDSFNRLFNTLFENNPLLTRIADILKEPDDGSEDWYNEPPKNKWAIVKKMTNEDTHK